MSNPILEAELAEEMHEFVPIYGEDMECLVDLHDMIDQPVLRIKYAAEWMRFTEDFQEYISNQ